MDPRRVNTKLELNAYIVPTQDEILLAFAEANVLSSLNIVKTPFNRRS
jgi:hypothetical protein